MDGEELFGVLVRLVGFVAAFYGGYCGVWGIVFLYMPHLKASNDPKQKVPENPSTYFFAAAIYIFFGLFTIAAADKFAEAAYFDHPRRERIFLND